VITRIIGRARIKQLKAFEKLINCRFRKKELLNAALTHKSYAFECRGKQNLEWNERLEFFGDSVLGLVVSEYLYRKFKNIQEGELSKFKSHIVCADTMAKIAVKLKIGDFLLLGRGEERYGGRNQLSNLSCALEAVIGAVYLDRNLKGAEKFILNVFGSDIADLSKEDRPNKDYKSALQEKSLKRFGHIPRYELISQDGPEHKKEFVVSVRLDSDVIGKGWGLNKKNAEQMAAKEALEKLKA